jgi:hypothetical protein
VGADAAADEAIAVARRPAGAECVAMELRVLRSP